MTLNSEVRSGAQAARVEKIEFTICGLQPAAQNQIEDRSGLKSRRSKTPVQESLPLNRDSSSGTQTVQIE